MREHAIATLVHDLGKLLLPGHFKIATAESCTGGMLACAIVSDIDASSILERAFVVYSVDAKCEMLGLERDRVEECGGVAKDAAIAMARSALQKSGADLAVAITGFAGPREGDEEVGLIHIATAYAQGVHHKALHLGDIGRKAACEQAVAAALEMMIEVSHAFFAARTSA